MNPYCGYDIDAQPHFFWQQDAMLTRVFAGAASSAIEVCDRGPKDVGDMSVRPLPRFAHSAVVVPSSFCGKHSMVRQPTYIHAFLCYMSAISHGIMLDSLRLDHATAQPAQL